MLEPQSTFLFLLLIVAFAALMWWMIRTRRIVLRVVAAFVAFIMAVQFGVMAVNRYFDYYQTWGAAFADLTNAPPATKGPGSIPVSAVVKDQYHGLLYGHTIFAALAQQQGYPFEATITGPLSHITRSVYVYLPPQYFQAAYRNYQFPVIELIHGQPGEPQDWINVVGVQAILRNLVNRGVAKPAVLVMPDANGGERVSEQCLNQVGGQQDMTYLGLDVPNVISREIPRVQKPGPGWGLAGYSEGGYCAANMALQQNLMRRFGAAASLSGYFVPTANQLPSGKMVNPFRGNKALTRENTPIDQILTLKPGSPIPQFWLGAGSGDQQDVSAANYFWQELQVYQPNVPLKLSKGGHTMGVWRAQVPPMLQWMTTLLARNVTAMYLRIKLADKRDCGALTKSKTDPPAGKQPTTKITPGPGTSTSTNATTPATCRQKLPTKKAAPPPGKHKRG
jgi:enterochelin esterase-like enzyme